MSGTSNYCTLSQLKKLEVINLCNGKRMGYIQDVEFDLCLGHICAILLPKKYELSDFVKKDGCRAYRIAWSDIERIGSDTILVRYNEGQR